MKTTTSTSLYWLAIPLLMSGCSLLFSPGGESGDAALNYDGRVYDAGIASDAATSPGNVMRLRVASDNSDFSTFEQWKAARSGNFTRRQLLRVHTTGNFAAKMLSSDVSECAGRLRPGSEDTPIPEDLLTIDLNDGLSGCRVGDVLTNSSDGTATVLAAGPVGAREVVTIFTDMLTGMSLAAGDFETSASSTLRLFAGTDHKGVPGDGVVISGAPDSSLFSVHIDVPHVRLFGFEVTNWPASMTGMRAAGVNVTADHVLLNRMLVHQPGTVTDPTSDGIFVHNAKSVIVRNSFVFNVGRAGIHMSAAGTASQLSVLNCSLANCMQGNIGTGSGPPPTFGCVSVAGDDHSLQLINTVAFANAGSPEFIAENWAGSTNNAAAQDKAVYPFGVEMQAAEAASFVSLSNLHLADTPTPTVTINGIHIPGIALDIDNETRPGPDAGSWAIGADHPAFLETDAGPN